MRHLILLMILLLFALPSLAQENDDSAYEIALQRIEIARINDEPALDLTHLGLTELPPEIGTLPNLERLYLANNHLNTLPLELGYLSNLRWLNLRNNRFSQLPKLIAELEALELLDVSHNFLIRLPYEITQLRNLCSLNLIDNSIEELPIGLYQLRGLRVAGCGINLEHNFQLDLPETVLDGGTNVILDYLEALAWETVKPLMLGAVGTVGLLAAIVLGLRWRSRGGKRKRKNKEKRHA